MLLQQFPDINMVRQLRNESTASGREWMNVAINVRSGEASRTRVEGPFSIFANLQGHSYCKINGKNHRVDSGHLLISLPGDQYDLEIDNLQKTETFNIHINQKFFESCAVSILNSSNNLLDANSKVAVSNNLLNKGMQQSDRQFSALLTSLKSVDNSDSSGYEMVFADIVTYVIQKDQSLRAHIQNLPSMKASVKEEIYKRLSLAKDLIYSNYFAEIDLDQLATLACMSKFHFLRMFKAFFGHSPHQFLTQVRLEKSISLLRSGQHTVTEIADSIGFQYPNSFIKTFSKTYGESPLKYLKSGNSNFG